MNVFYFRHHTAAYHFLFFLLSTKIPPIEIHRNVRE